MTLGGRLSTSIVLLLLGFVFLARAQAVSPIDERDEEENAEIPGDGLMDIKKQLLDLQKVLAQQHKLIDSQIKDIHLKLHTLAAKEETNHPSNATEIDTMCLSLITDAIHEVFSSSGCNFDTLINLPQGLSNPVLNSQILMALYEEVEKPNHWNVKNLIMLDKAFQRISNFKTDDEKVNKTVKKLRNAIIFEASNIFIAAMKSDINYGKNQTVVETSAELNGCRSGDVAAVMQRTIQEVFYVVDFPIFLSAVNTHRSLWQRIAGMDAVKDQMHKAGLMSDYVDVYIASQLKEILSDAKYVLLEQAMRTAVDALVTKLPKNIRNLFLLPHFCIYNKLRYSYLIASNFLFDLDLRSVLTVWRSETDDLPSGALWRLSYKQQMFFDNVDFPGEYIYADVHECEKIGHHVYTRKPTNNTDSQRSWNIKSEDGSLLLRSEHFDEYLYASEEEASTALNNTGSLQVCTKKKHLGKQKLAFQWQITEC